MFRTMFSLLAVAAVVGMSTPALAGGCKGCAKVAKSGDGFCCGKGKAFGVKLSSKKLYAALAGRTVAEVCAEYEGSMFSKFKPALTELAVSTLAPIADEMRRLLDDPGHIDGLLADGAARAGSLARETVAEVHRIMGLSR